MANRTLLRTGLALTAALAFSPLAAADSGYSLSIGAEYTRGDYGTGGDISLTTVPITLEYAEPRYAWSVTLPYLWVSGPGDFVVSGAGMGRLSPTQTTSPSRTDSGLGDVRVSGTLRLVEEAAGRPWVALTTRVKFATADETRRLGTGENDYALQLELAKSALYGHAGYKILGDPPGVDYRDVWYGAVGVNFAAGESDGGLELYAEQAQLEGLDGKQELTLYLGQALDSRTRLTGYLLTGLSDASPDFGGGVSLRYAW